MKYQGAKGCGRIGRMLLGLLFVWQGWGAAAGETKQRLATGWEFYQGSLGSTWVIWRGDKASDNVTWTPVTLPHCFNAREDAASRSARGAGRAL